MKVQWILVCLLLIAACAGRADLPPVKDRLQMPAIVKARTPAHWLRLHRLSERSPDALLEVLERYAQACESGEVQPVVICAMDAPDPRSVDRLYALRRLGDVGGEETIAALQKFINRRLENGTMLLWSDMILTQLTIERIRVRQAGRSAYVAEMIRWLRGEFTPARHPATIAPEGSVYRATDHWEGMFRIRQALRALGVLRAREAIPVLLDKRQWGRFPDMPEVVNALYADALAQMGDKRVLDALNRCLREWVSYATPPLEPGQVDPAWAYWQMRTQGMNPEQTVNAMVSALAGNDTRRGVVEILTIMGRPIVPYLLKSLAQPPGPDTVQAQCGVINALGNIRAVEAVEPLRQLLRQSPSAVVRGVSAEALGKIGDPSVIPDVVTLLSDENRSVRVSAVQALGEMKHPEAIPPLLKVLREHPDEFTRTFAVSALESTGMRWLVPILEYQMMVEGSELVQDYLRGALANLRNSR